MTEPSLIRYFLRKKCKAPFEEWSRSGRDGHVPGADIGSIVTLPYCPCWREVMKTITAHQLQFIVPVFCPSFIHFAKKDIRGRRVRPSDVRSLTALLQEEKLLQVLLWYNVEASV